MVWNWLDIGVRWNNWLNYCRVGWTEWRALVNNWVIRRNIARVGNIAGANWIDWIDFRPRYSYTWWSNLRASCPTDPAICNITFNHSGFELRSDRQRRFIVVLCSLINQLRSQIFISVNWQFLAWISVVINNCTCQKLVRIDRWISDNSHWHWLIRIIVCISRRHCLSNRWSFCQSSFCIVHLSNPILSYFRWLKIKTPFLICFLSFEIYLLYLNLNGWFIFEFEICHWGNRSFLLHRLLL